MRDRRDVDASANNVGCDQDLDGAVSKRFEYRISLRLIHVAMDRTESHIGERRDTMQHFFELVMQFGRSEFCAAKDNRLRWFLACQQLDQDVKFSIRRDGEIALLDGVD